MYYMRFEVLIALTELKNQSGVIGSNSNSIRAVWKMLPQILPITLNMNLSGAIAIRPSKHA